MVISLFKISPNWSTEVLSTVPKCKKAAICLMENIVLDKLHSGMSYSVLLGSSTLTNQQYVLNKVSPNRNMHKAKLCVDYVTKVL